MKGVFTLIITINQPANSTGILKKSLIQFMKLRNIPELLLDPLLRSLTPESASDNDKVWLVVVVLVELLCAESGRFPGDFSFGGGGTKHDTHTDKYTDRGTFQRL